MMILFYIHLLLIFAYLIFKLSQKGETFFSYFSESKRSLRVAQGLVILSLLAPMMLQILPKRHSSLELLDFPIFQLNEKSKKINRNVSQNKINTFISNTRAVDQAINISSHVNVLFFIKLFWVLGSFFYLSKFILNYWRLKESLLNSIILKKVNRLCIVVSSDHSIPFSVRLCRMYWVVIPIHLLDKKSDLRLAIKHEVQHHRQGDTSWAIFIELMICVFFFNPAIYFWKNTIIELQEFTCDEALTGQSDVLSHEYGNCLLRVAETALKNRQMYAGTTSMAAFFKNSKYYKTFLLRRIEMIVERRKKHSKWLPVCTGLVLSLMTLTLAYSVEQIRRAKAHSVNGGSLVVDAEIQKIADESLTRALKGTRFSAGFVIVADPMTGKILAVANQDTKNIKKGYWALSELIEPASFAKTFVIAQAIEKRVTNPNDIHQCENGKYNYKGKLYRDWKSVGWKELTTTETLANSSDICSIKIGEKVGRKSLEEMIENFGFGEEGTAKDFPQARVGEDPMMGEHFIPKMALGYAFKHSPLEILQAMGAMANGGNLMKPIMANEKNSKVIRRILSPETSLKMKRILQEVVLSGTAKGQDRAESSFYTTAGKTASARLNDFMNIDWYGGERPNYAGFVGFAPVGSPRIEVFVGLIDPDADRNKTGAHGGEHAAPLFKEVTENVLAFMKVKPDKI